MVETGRRTLAVVVLHLSLAACLAQKAERSANEMVQLGSRDMVATHVVAADEHQVAIASGAGVSGLIAGRVAKIEMAAETVDALRAAGLSVRIVEQFVEVEWASGTSLEGADGSARGCDSTFFAAGNESDVPIPDDPSGCNMAPTGGISTGFEVSGHPANRTVCKVQYAVLVSHTYPRDLVIQINSDNHPLGQGVSIWNRAGGTDDGGLDCDTASDEDIDFSFGCRADISFFNGEPLNGLWYLDVWDHCPVDVGTIRYFRLRLYYEAPPQPPSLVDSGCVITPAVADRGARVNISYHVLNPNDYSITVDLGFSIFGCTDGQTYHGPTCNALNVALAPGESTHTRCFDIPSTAPYQAYNAVWCIWNEIAVGNPFDCFERPCYLQVRDAVAPTSPGAPDLAASSDSGQSNSDNITRDPRPIFTWTASTDAGSGVEAYYVSYLDSSPSPGEPSVDRTTATVWQSSTPIPDGSRTIYVRARDHAGNLSAVTQATYVIDTSPPPPPTQLFPLAAAEACGDEPLFRWASTSGIWKRQVNVQSITNASFQRTSPELPAATLQWRVSPSLEVDHDWEWRMQAWDVAGNLGCWGANGVCGVATEFRLAPTACGKDNIACLSPGTVYNNRRPVARLLVNGQAWCTGWLIGSPDCLITNAHCLEGVDPADMQAEFHYECDQCVDGSVGSTVLVDVERVIATNARLDYALLDLAGSPTATFGRLNVTCDDVVVGEECYTIHHGSGRVKSYDDGTFTRAAQPGSCTDLGPIDAQVRYTLLGKGGSSGSPVFQEASHAVQVLHHCGVPCSPNDSHVGVPLAAILPDALPWIEAHGAAVSLVRRLPQPTYLSPPNGGPCHPENVCLSWNDVSGAASYDVYWGTTNPPPFWRNTVENSVCPPNQVGTTYYWNVRARSACEPAAPGPTWSYTTCAITGACCMGATCQVTTQANCTSGIWLAGEVCEPSSPCVGACCLWMGGCQLTLEQECVQNGLGVFQGVGTSCPPGDCVPTGACCFSFNGSCIVAIEYECRFILEGEYLGDGTTCTPNPCVATGACCYPGGGCDEGRTELECDAAAGYFAGSGSECFVCPLPGACCLPNQTCSVLAPWACESAGGTFQGKLTNCTADLCTPRGACCLIDGSCQAQLTQAQCYSHPWWGTWWFGGADCSAAICAPDVNCEVQAPHDYGITASGNCGDAYTWIIANLGPSELDISIALVGANADEFYIAEGDGPYTLGDFGEAPPLRVRFCPTSPGSKVAILRIQSNDPDESQCDIALSGTGGQVEAPDCNMNNIDDRVDIVGGASRDCNDNGVPDECEISGQAILVCSKETDSLLAFDPHSGNYMRAHLPANHAGLNYPNGVLVDAAGDIYVSSAFTGSVLKFDGDERKFVRAMSGCGLQDPVGLAFRGANEILVASYSSDSVVAFDRHTGACISQSRVSPGSGGLDGAGAVLLTPEDRLLVCSERSNQVLEFDAGTGAFIRVAAEGAELSVPGGLALDAQGDILVSSLATDAVLRFNRWGSGSLLGALVAPSEGGLDGPEGLGWGIRGELLVCSRWTGSVKAFNPATGDFLHDLTAPGLIEPTFLTVGPVRFDCFANSVPDDCDIAAGAAPDGNGNGVPDTCEPSRGDMNCDGFVTVAAIGGFVLSLTNPAGYLATYPNCQIINADMNLDGFVTVADIGAFVQLLTGR